MSKPTSRILSKKDDVSHQDSLDIYKHFRKDHRSGLVVPIDHIDHRELHCQACGKPFLFGQKKGRYFDEIFHDECCQIMLRGGSCK